MLPFIEQWQSNEEIKLNIIYKENKYTRIDNMFSDFVADSEYANFSHLSVV